MDLQMVENVKIAMRHLPKHMTESEVLGIIGEFPNEVLSYYFVPADLSFEPLAFSTMYIVFSGFCDSLFEFEKRFDNYIFVDSKGFDSACNIELTVYQGHAKCDREELKNDAKCGKITEESYFKKFMKKLAEAENTPIITLEQQILRLGRGDDAKAQLEKLDTPLVKYIYNEQIEKQQANLYRKAQREAKRSARVEVASSSTVGNEGAAPGPSRRRVVEHKGRNEEKKVEEKVKEKKKRPMDPARLEKKRERDAIRKQKFLEKKWLADHGVKETTPQALKEMRDAKKKEYPKSSRNYRGMREAPKLSDHVGEDWIKKLTDPKSNLRRSENNP